MDSTTPPRRRLASRFTPGTWALTGLALVGLNYFFAYSAVDQLKRGSALVAVALGLVLLVSFPAQFVAAAFAFSKHAAKGRTRRLVPGLFAVAAMLGNAWLGFVAGAAALFVGMGGAWGRPLRVRGRQVHADLDEGDDWAHGEQPDVSDLDDATRHALEALWLHDAQKEHASVPAFSRVSWLLAGLGAPPELLRWSHRAAIEEIAHARLCFALAAGYGGRTHTVRPLPELLNAGLGLDGDALAVVMSESLGDGCLLEDFNADVAGECAGVCEEPVTRAALARITREERSHAEFSWAVVEWLLRSAGDPARHALERAISGLDGYVRPTAVARDKHPIVARADPGQLRRHGRLPDERWAELWRDRLALTKERARGLLDSGALRDSRQSVLA